MHCNLRPPDVMEFILGSNVSIKILMTVNNGDTSCGSEFRVMTVLAVYDNIVTYLCSASSICSVSST